MMSTPLNALRRASLDDGSPSISMAPGHLEEDILAQGKRLPDIEESLEARLERLGRERPEVFKSIWAEVGFVFSTCMASVLSVSIAYSISVLSQYRD